jgi:hypothetical protein
MVQGPPDSSANEDPTSEEEALEFDGTSTDQLDDTYRFRVVAASESANGTVGFDERGRSHWKWITEVKPLAQDASGTFDQLKALENPALALEDDRGDEPRRASQAGYDPYATGVFDKPKIRR